MEGLPSTLPRLNNTKQRASTAPALVPPGTTADATDTVGDYAECGAERRRSRRRGAL